MQYSFFKHLFKLHLIHLIGFILFVLISFSIRENDTGVAIFGTFLYLPFVILMIGYNILVLSLTKSYLTAIKPKWIIYLTPLIPVLIWYLVADFSITIRFWRLEKYEFWIFMAAWSLFNLILHAVLNKKNQL